MIDSAEILDQWHLVQSESGLGLSRPGMQKPVRVDFSSPQLQRRRPNELLIKALGVKQSSCRYVIDATAGMGNDAFLIARAGCTLTMIERSPIIAALLEDGIARASQSQAVQAAAARMSLIEGDAIALIPKLAQQQQPDMIYLDPMFPSRNKSALPKKAMQNLQSLVGNDDDQARLLEIALQNARFRVVVKRHAKAQAIDGAKPAYCLASKQIRYDIYALRKLA